MIISSAFAHKLLPLVPKHIRDMTKGDVFSVGESGYDPWGLHPETATLGLACCKVLHDYYFKVTAHGLNSIPKKGGCLFVANHSGQWFPIDAMMIYTAAAFNPHGSRLVRAMVERMFPNLPYVGSLVFRAGMTLGDPINCQRLLQRDEAVLVFPEGERGFIKPPEEKYKLQRMGNGFIRMAIENKVPIVPIGVVGCEELTPNFGRSERLAKYLGLPALPLSPPLALPTRIYLNVGTPVQFEHRDYSNDEYDDMVNVIRTDIEALIQKGLNERTSVF